MRCVDRRERALLATAALLLGACTSGRLLEPPRVFTCNPGEAGTDTAPAPPAPVALSDLPVALPLSNGRPSGDAAEAKRLFDGERWAQAEPLLRRVARGEAGDDRDVRQRAERDLGAALFYQDKLEESLTVFLSISANPDHEAHADAAAWLFRLAQKGPPYLDRAARALALYPLGRPPDMADDHRWQAWWGVLHIVGRYFYRTGHYDTAVGYFARVPPRSDAYDLSRECLAVICARPGAPAACGGGPR